MGGRGRKISGGAFGQQYAGGFGGIGFGQDSAPADRSTRPREISEYRRQVNNDGTLRTTGGGVNWERIEFADSQRKRVTKFFFTKTGAGLAIGEGGAFFVMTTDKKIWKRMPSPLRYLMFDGVFTDESNGVVGGAGGSILFTADAGLSWTKAAVFGSAETKLNSVFFIN